MAREQCVGLIEFRKGLSRILGFGLAYTFFARKCFCDEAGNVLRGRKLDQQFCGSEGHAVKTWLQSTGFDDSTTILAEIIACRIFQDWDFYAESILRRLMEPKMAQRWSRKAFHILIPALDKLYGLGFPLDEDDFMTAFEFYQIRNLLEHHGGRVSQQYLDLVPASHLRVGDPYPLTFEYVQMSGQALERVVVKLDRLLAPHLGAQPSSP